MLALENHDAAGLASVMPRLFFDAFGALPLRLAARRLLYLGFEESLDPVLALAMERMTGLRVESGIVQGSLFSAAHTRMLRCAFPQVELVEAVSEPAAALALTQSIERLRPVASRLVECTIACGCGCGEAHNRTAARDECRLRCGLFDWPDWGMTRGGFRRGHEDGRFKMSGGPPIESSKGVLGNE